MNGTPLSRHAGPVILIVGVYIAVTHIALLFALSGGELPALAADPLFRGVSLAYAAAFAGLLLALFAAYVRQAREAGRFGFFALFAAILGTFTLGADMWFEGFASPWLLEVSPQVLTAEKTTIWVTGFLSSYILFALGWALFGLASLRARVFPVPISVALTIGGLIGFLAAAPPWGAALGLALAWLGGWLIKSEPTLVTFPERRRSARVTKLFSGGADELLQGQQQIQRQRGIFASSRGALTCPWTRETVESVPNGMGEARSVRARSSAQEQHKTTLHTVQCGETLDGTAKLVHGDCDDWVAVPEPVPSNTRHSHLCPLK